MKMTDEKIEAVAKSIARDLEASGYGPEFWGEIADAMKHVRDEVLVERDEARELAEKYRNQIGFNAHESINDLPWEGCK